MLVSSPPPPQKKKKVVWVVCWILVGFLSKMVLFHGNVCLPEGTPWKIHGWNLKITQLKRKIIFHPPPWRWVHVNFPIGWLYIYIIITYPPIRGTRKLHWQRVVSGRLGKPDITHNNFLYQGDPLLVSSRPTVRDVRMLIEDPYIREATTSYIF